MIYYRNQYDRLLADDDKYYEYSDVVVLEDIKRYMKLHHQRKHDQACIQELGVDDVRFDFVSLNPHRRYIRILEYKVGRRDFLGDRKVLDYMAYCNTLSFVTPLGMVGREELIDDRIGLLQVFKWRHRGREEGWRLGAIWVKRPGGRKLAIERYYRVADMMLARVVQGRKRDIF